MTSERPFEDGGALPGRGRRGRFRAPWVWVIVIVAVAGGTYVGTLGNGFAFDDWLVVVINCRTWQNDTLWQLLQHDYWNDLQRDVLYRPVTTVSHVLNYRLSGERPATYRAINIVLHAACCCCLFGLTCAVFGDRRLAGATSVLFAAHALHVEAVAQVVGRAELLAGVLGLLALWVYVVDARQKKGRPTWRYPIAAVLTGLAILSKESAVAVIAVAGFFDLWSVRFGTGGFSRPAADRPADVARGRISSALIGRLVLQRWVGMFLVVLIVLAIRMQVLGMVIQDQGSIPKVDNPIAQASSVGRVLTPVVLLGKYVWLLVWPDPLCHDYSYNALPVCETPLDLRFAWGLLCIVGMVAGGIRSYRRAGGVLWCIVFFLLNYVLVSNTVVLSGTIFAERLMYMPSAAFCWLVAIGVVGAAEGISGRAGSERRGCLVIAPVFALLCTAHVFLTVRRGQVWRSEAGLVASALALTDDSARIHLQAGYCAMNEKDAPTAIRHLKRSLEIMPDFLPAYFQLGRAYLMDGQFEKAIQYLKRFYIQAPDGTGYTTALCIAQAYERLGRREEAKRWLARARELRPTASSAGGR